MKIDHKYLSLKFHGNFLLKLAAIYLLLNIFFGLLILLR